MKVHVCRWCSARGWCNKHFWLQKIRGQWSKAFSHHQIVLFPQTRNFTPDSLSTKVYQWKMLREALWWTCTPSREEVVIFLVVWGCLWACVQLYLPFYYFYNITVPPLWHKVLTWYFFTISSSPAQYTAVSWVQIHTCEVVASKAKLSIASVLSILFLFAFQTQGPIFLSRWSTKHKNWASLLLFQCSRLLIKAEGQ